MSDPSNIVTVDTTLELIRNAKDQVEAALVKANQSISILQQNLQNAAANKIGLEAQKGMLSELIEKVIAPKQTI